MLTRRPTIIDVAKAAGVSKSTVSLVLQDSALVRQETRQIVREAMARLGYVYNRAAANMRSSNVGLIGLVINDLRNPFFTEFAASAQMAFLDRGYATVVANTDENATLQAQVVGSMIEHGVSALVISPTYGDEDATFMPLERAGIPVMQVLRKVDQRTQLFPFASHDYEAGGREATRHLIELGARNIAFVGGLADRPITSERMAGYRAVLKDHGLQPFAMPGRASRAFGHEAALAIAQAHRHVDAALCFNDLVALGMQTGFSRAGLVPGKDFRLAGFDDIEECAQAWPPLTSVRCDIGGFARQIARQLLEWLEDGVRPPEEQRAPVALVARASTLGHAHVRTH
ncbi:MAG: LacI family transcriptional regulator [Rhizobiaceae bacterium]|jgi:LacI family transcriptional regulator|nr:LacI family transcriptional regulator [Rhizobiaceae bacterium]